MLLIILMYALFAAEFPLVKIALRETNAFFLEMMRMLIGGIMLLGLYRMRFGSMVQIARIDWPIFVQLIIFYMYLSYFSSGWALQYMSSLKANILHAAVPFVSALLAYILVQDRVTPQKIVGMLIGSCGLLTILAISDKASIPWGKECAQVSWPELMMFVSIVSTEYGYFLVKRLYDKGYSLLLINGITMFVGGSLSLLSALIFFEHQVVHYSSLGSVLIYATILFFVMNGLDIAFYGTLIKKYSITFLTFANFLSPLFGILYGTIFMGESISPLHGVASGLIFLGLYLFSKAEVSRQVTGRLV